MVMVMVMVAVRVRVRARARARAGVRVRVRYLRVRYLSYDLRECLRHEGKYNENGKHFDATHKGNVSSRFHDGRAGRVLVALDWMDGKNVAAD
jgi:hypothetical protein